MALGPEAQLGQGPMGPGQGPMQGSGALQGGYGFGEAPGTSGSLESIFSDQAHMYKQDRLKQEEEDDERRAGRMKTLETAGKTTMRQAEMAADARTLQTAKWKDQGMIGKSKVGDKMVDNPFQVNEPTRGTWDFKNKMSDIFSTDQQLGLSGGSAESLKGGDFQAYQDFVGTDQFGQSGMDATQLGKDLGWGDMMDFDPAGAQGPMPLPGRGEVADNTRLYWISRRRSGRSWRSRRSTSFTWSCRAYSNCIRRSSRFS